MNPISVSYINFIKLTFVFSAKALFAWSFLGTVRRIHIPDNGFVIRHTAGSENTLILKPSDNNDSVRELT